MATKRTTRRFIAYVRVSKLGERDPEELKSPEIQRRAIDAYADRYDDIEVIDYVEDLDRTGRTFEHRAVKDIIERIKAGEGDGVLIWIWSRWGRNQEDTQIYLRRVKLAGGVVIAVSQDIDQSTAFGRFQLQLQQSMDELQSNQISESWRTAQRLRTEKGLMGGGPPPFGYRRVSKHEPFQPDPITGPIVVEMYDRYLRGQGPMKIAVWLRQVGVLTPPRRRNGGEAEGRKFSISTVQRVLDSGFAAGYLSFGVRNKPEGMKGSAWLAQRWETQKKGAHEPVIDEETWQRYKRERKRREGNRPKDRQPTWYLGAGLAVCGLCGSSLTATTLQQPDRSQVRCAGYALKTQDCTGVWVKRQTIDACVDIWLEEHLKDWADARDAIRGADDERAQLTNEITEARAELEQFETGRRNALNLVGRGLATQDEYEAMLAENQSEPDATASRIDEVQLRLDALDPDADVMERLGDDDIETEPEEMNMLLKRILRKVSVTKQEITITPWRGDAWVWNRISGDWTA